MSGGPRDIPAGVTLPLTTMTVRAVTVYVELPSSLTRPLDLAQSNWSWVHCLTFPIDDLLKLKLSRKLYKWIRYAIVHKAISSTSKAAFAIIFPTPRKSGCSLPILTLHALLYVPL